MLDRLGWGPEVCWAWACVVLLASGALTHLGPVSPWMLCAGYALGTLYPALLLVGALGYAGRSVPRWLPPLALAIGAARGVAQAAGLHALSHGVALGLEPPLVLLAAVVVARAQLRGRHSLAQRLLPPFLVAMAGLEALSAVVMLGGEPLPRELLMAWVAGSPLLLAVQLSAWSVASRGNLERARELLEQRLQKESERYKVISELSSDYSFSYLIGPHRQLEREWVTDAVLRVTGYTAEELDGHGWYALVPPSERERVFREARNAPDQRRRRVVLRIRHKSGEDRWVQVIIDTRRRAREGFMRVVGVTRDITDLVRADEERRRLDAHLREMQRLESLGRLAGGIAHDFNNALTVILGNSKLALEEIGRGGVDRRRLHRVRAAAEYAAGLTEQILTYAGKAAVTLEPLDASRLVRETLELLHASLRGKVTLETDLADDLPAFEGDVTRIRQVLVNLVTNAAEAMDEKGGVVRLRTGATSLARREIADCYGSPDVAPGRYVLLEVFDNGPGLAAAERSRVFEPFYTTKSAGRGLGLASVLGNVRAHGGLIRVESEPGSGTTFQIFLPCTRRVPAEKALRPTAPANGRGRVLVVDDDDAVLEVAAAFLTRAGFEVTTAGGGRAALDLLRDPELEVDAVVLDLVIPDVPAAEIFLELRQLRPTLPVVLASGYDREQVASRFPARDVAGFVRKPFGPEELVESVRVALGS